MGCTSSLSMARKDMAWKVKAIQGMERKFMAWKGME
jgi:hypothetical protein